MVLSQLGETVSTIVQGFHIVRSSILHLVSVILNSVWETLHLAVDKPTIRVDYRVRAIKLYRLVEIMN